MEVVWNGSCAHDSENNFSFVRLDAVSVQPSDYADAQQYAAHPDRMRPLLCEPGGPPPAEQDLGARACPAALCAVRDAVR